MALAATAVGTTIAPVEQTPTDASVEPLARAWLLAVPATYRLETTVRARTLVFRHGRRLRLPPEAREVGEVGTAFGVRPDGVVVSAAHVAQPSAEALAIGFAQGLLAVLGRPHSDLAARRFARRTGARVVHPVVTRVLVPARSQPGRRAPVAHRVALLRSDRGADVALLRFPARNAPALPLFDDTGYDTPVVVLGFGGEDVRGDLVPAYRPGRLKRTFLDLHRDGGRVTAVTSEIERGDSGGPAVDRNGRVRGVVRYVTSTGGLVEWTQAVRELLTRAGLSPVTGPTTPAFRTAMQSFWHLDERGAARGLARTLALDPAHTVAPVEAARLDRLTEARYALVGAPLARGALLALGVASALIAAACGIALVRRLLEPPPEPIEGAR
jgi:S1-C subfamily serine protease